MASTGVAGLICASVVLAALVAALCARTGRRRGGAPVAAGAFAGAVVLALALLNVYQFVRHASAGTSPSPGWGWPRVAGAQGEFDGPASTPPAPPPTTARAEPFLTDPAEQDVVDAYARHFYDKDGTWQRRQWLGVRAMQNPNDAWQIQEIMAELKPDFVVEAGTASGGGALFWATVLGQVNPAGRVITIDIQDLSQAARAHPLWRERVEFIHGSSTDPAVVASIAERVRGGRALVILDSDHRYPHVLAELKAYAPLVPVGGYVVVQDSNVNGHPVAPGFGPGPMEAIDAFLAADDRFAVDRSRESLLHTMHPRGYLKRLK